MAEFAVVENGVVTNVIVAESRAIAEELTGKTCIEYTDANPAEIGGTYDSSKSKFVGVQPFASWVLNSNDVWQPPVAMPTDGKPYKWDEETKVWVLLS